MFEGIENGKIESNLLGAYRLSDPKRMDEFKRHLATLNEAQRQTVLKRLNNQHISKGSRAEFEKHLIDVPEHIVSKLDNGDLRLSEALVKAIKPVSSKTVKLFESSDTKKTGLRSLAEGKLPKNQVMLVSGIYLLAGVSAGAGDDEVMATNFREAELIPAIANAEFYFKANKKTIVPEGTSIRKFCTKNNTTVALGFWKLDNPRIIEEDEPIEFVVELGTLSGIAANTQLLVELHGTWTTA
jgi:hypothetical protein